MKKSVFGLDENIAAMLAYLGAFVSGIIILILERENKTVRFAALQSTIFFVGLAIVSTVIGWVLPIVGWIPLLGGLITGLVSTALTVIFLASIAFLSYTAYKGKQFKIPVLGDIVESQINK